MSASRQRPPPPDRIESARRSRVLPPIWPETLKGALHHMRHGRPEVPPGARLAPTPSGGRRLIGHLREARSAPLDYFLRWREERGDVVRLQLAGVTAHLVSSPEAIRWILQEGNKRFTKPIQGRENLAAVLGNGLLVTEGSFWLRQRRIAQPAFRRARIEAFAERMAEAAEGLAAEWLAGPGEREVTRDMMALTLRVVQETLLGGTARADAGRVADAMEVVLAEFNRRFSRVFNPPPEMPIIGNPKLVESIAVLDEAVLSMIQERRAEAARGQASGRDDLLTMLLEARDEDTGEGMDDEQLRDEVMTMFLAGHETTANALSWAFYLLGKHPAAARRVREEVLAVAGDERRVTAADARALPFTSAVLSETMRLYPPAWIIARSPIEDEEVQGFHIPARSRIFLSPWVIHRHPELWPNPEAFDPGRFMPGQEIDRFAYIPFGGGPRLCIGHHFAMMEATILLATLARRAHLELVPGHPVVPEATVTLRPKGGLQVRVRAH